MIFPKRSKQNREVKSSETLFSFPMFNSPFPLVLGGRHNAIGISKTQGIHLATTGCMTGFLFKKSLYFSSKACPMVRIKSFASPGAHSKMKQPKTNHKYKYIQCCNNLY